MTAIRVYAPGSQVTLKAIPGQKFTVLEVHILSKDYVEYELGWWRDKDRITARFKWDEISHPDQECLVVELR